MQRRDAMWISATVLASVVSFTVARIVFAEHSTDRHSGGASTVRRQSMTPQARPMKHPDAASRRELAVMAVPDAWIDRLEREPESAERVRAAVIDALGTRTPGVAACVKTDDVGNGVELRFVVDVVSTADVLVVGDAEYIHATVGPALPADAEACIEEHLRGRDVVTAAAGGPFLDYTGPVEYLLVIGG